MLFPVDTARKLNVYKTFNLGPVFTGLKFTWREMKREIKICYEKYNHKFSIFIKKKKTGCLYLEDFKVFTDSV